MYISPHKTLLALFIAIGLTSSASGQLIVDGSGTTPGTTHLSITTAVAAASAGTTIDIVGLVDGTGLPVGYTQTGFFVGQPGELFPISVPGGVTLRQMGNTPVYIWDSVGGPPDLFTVLGTSTLSPTRFRNLNFAGGRRAINVEIGSAALRADVIIRDCRFTSNQIGARAATTGGATVQMGALDCILSDTTISVSPSAAQPVFQPIMFGFQYTATGDAGPTSPSTTIGGIEELTVTGAFTTMNPQPGSFSYDLTVPTTRVVDVVVSGDSSNVIQFPTAPASYAPAEIPEVQLDILGGVWDGAAAGSGAGWGSAIHAEVNGSDQNPQSNYYAGYRINVTGTEIRDFREDGIFCGSSLNSRGHLDMNGNTSITDSGFVGPFSEILHSGVHIYARESYMGLTATACEFSLNQGNGIYLNTDGELATDTSNFRLMVPSGIFLGLSKNEIHQNDANGIYLRSQPTQPSGFIGGTIHQIDTESGAPFTIDDDVRDFSYTDGAAIPNGQGVINRTAISNNGFAGVHIVAQGDSGIIPDKPDGVPSGVAVRISNDFIWSNPRGGLYSEWRIHAGEYDFYAVQISKFGNG